MKRIEVVAAIIKDNNQRILCTQRGATGSIPLKWEFPGGKVEKNESQQAALVREIQEELCIEINVIEYLMTVNHQYPTFEISLHAYFCQLSHNDYEIVLNEHQEYRWLNVEQFSLLDWAPADIPIVERLKATI